MFLLAGLFFIFALMSAIVGSMAGMTPSVVLLAHICLAVTIILFLISLIAGLMKEDKHGQIIHHHSGHRMARG